MSERAKSICEAVGGLLFVAGVALVYIPAALIVAGLALVAAGNLPERR